jgi:hypothetical protein
MSLPGLALQQQQQWQLSVPVPVPVAFPGPQHSQQLQRLQVQQQIQAQAQAHAQQQAQQQQAHQKEALLLQQLQGLAVQPAAGQQYSASTAMLGSDYSLLPTHGYSEQPPAMLQPSLQPLADHQQDQAPAYSMHLPPEPAHTLAMAMGSQQQYSAAHEQACGSPESERQPWQPPGPARVPDVAAMEDNFRHNVRRLQQPIGDPFLQQHFVHGELQQVAVQQMHPAGVESSIMMSLAGSLVAGTRGSTEAGHQLGPLHSGGQQQQHQLQQQQQLQLQQAQQAQQQYQQPGEPGRHQYQ